MAKKRKCIADDDDDDDMSRVGRPRTAETFGPPRPEPHQREEYVRRLQAIIIAVEIDADLSMDVRFFLQKMLWRCDLLRNTDAKRFPAKADEQVTLLLRTVFESANGVAALTLPILQAVSGCMGDRWVEQGLAWIEFFDSIGLVELLEQIRALDFCDEGDLEKHLREAIRRRRRFGPPKIAVVPKKKPARLPMEKAVRPLDISPAAAWDEVLAMRKKRPKAPRVGGVDTPQDAMFGRRLSEGGP